MLKIRLSRRGKKRQPSYRVVVADINSKRDGRIVERIGHYNPLVEPSEFAIREDRALHWLSVGAQPTDAVRRLLDKQGTFDRLGRLHAGESLEVLAAEVTGVAVAAPQAVEEVVEEEETVVEDEEESVVAAAVEAEQEVVADVAETGEDVGETAVEAVADADGTGDDDEEAVEVELDVEEEDEHDDDDDVEDDDDDDDDDEEDEEDEDKD